MLLFIVILVLALAVASYGYIFRTRQWNTVKTELAELKIQFSRNVLHDKLTELPSRQVFLEHLEAALAQSARYHMMFGIVFVDLDGFKFINETLGHDVGDIALREIAIRLRENVRQVDVVSRFEGDKFVFILPRVNKPESVAYVARRLLDVIAEPLTLQKQEFYLTGSAGIAVYPGDGIDAAILLKNAENALNRAKAHGRNSYQFYQQEMYVFSHRELILDSCLRSEDIYRDFVIYYRPEVNIKTKQVICVNALLHWQHSLFGLLEFDAFSRLAEESGKILAIGEWLLRSACEQFQKWQSLGFSPESISVTVLMKQLENPHFIQKITDIIHQTQIKPACLVLEIAETSLSRQMDRVENALYVLKQLGCRVAISHFGAGHLSLHHLRRLTVDTLKIDESLIQDIATNKDDQAIVKMIFALAQVLEINIVAEGVENSHQKQALEALGCFMMQGKLFSHSVLPQELIHFTV